MFGTIRKHQNLALGISGGGHEHRPRFPFFTPNYNDRGGRGRRGAGGRKMTMGPSTASPFVRPDL